MKTYVITEEEFIESCNRSDRGEPEPQYKSLEVNPPELLCGIYFLMVGDNLMYVGKSVNLHRRLMDHRESRKYDTAIIVAMPAQEADAIELRAIKQFNPPWNRDHCNHNGKIYKRADVQEFVKAGCLITNDPYLKKRFAKMLREINPDISDAYIQREWQKVVDSSKND